MGQFTFNSVVEEPPELATHHTLVAVTLALCAHAMILLWWHVFAPEVEDIPVRVLHVKLGAGGDIFTQSSSPEQSQGGGAPSAAAPTPTQASNAQRAAKPSTASQSVSSRDIITAPSDGIAMPSMPTPVAKPNDQKNAKQQEQKTAQPQQVQQRATPQSQPMPTASQNTQQVGPSRGQGHARTGEGQRRFVRPAGSPLGEAGRKQADVIARYEQLLSAWIQKHKRYPTSARRQKLEGRAIVRVRINRTGNVIFHRLELRTGHGLLDQAALDMVARANPVPSVPAGYPQGELLEFLIPVSFRLN